MSRRTILPKTTLPIIRVTTQRALATLLLWSGIAGISPAAAPPNSGGSGSPSAWTGVITYTRTHSMTDHKTIERVSGGGKDTRSWEMKYDYKASVIVSEAPQKDGSSVAKASITHQFSSKETTVAVERNSCDRGKTWQDMTGTFVSESKASGQATEDATVHVGVNADGTYAVSVRLPDIKGMLTGSESSSFSGQCKPKPGKNRTLGPTPTRIDGNSLTSDGSHRVDPDDPNQLSGSYSLAIAGGVVETITWNLQRGGAPLRIIALTFEDMKYPNWNDWREVTTQTGTVDGNLVKIKATVLNAGGETKTGDVQFKATYKGDKWNGAMPDAPLAQQTFSVTLDAGEQRDVEMVWNSSGYAWFDDGRPRLVQRIKAEVWENSKKADERTENLKVRPKPIVLVPGIWTNPSVYGLYQNLFTTTHSYDWKACAVVDTPAQGTIAGEGTVTPSSTVNGSVYAHADNLTRYVDAVRTSLNAWHVDMLAHSTGGLVARLYIHKQMDVLPDALPVVKHLMMLGTPNNGVPCADALGSLKAFSNHVQTAKELMPDEIKLFNQYVTQRKGTRFSVLAGNSIPLLCASPEWNDGFVSVDSATHGVADVTLTSQQHPDMLSVETFNGYIRAHVITGPKGTYPFANASTAGP